jgi:hypothetical protein
VIFDTSVNFFIYSFKKNWDRKKGTGIVFPNSWVYWIVRSGGVAWSFARPIKWG